MKPKNRYFCIGCQRPKMLFESKSKADNFLKFNKDNFDRVPKRSYFCSFCGGWHISSISNIAAILAAKEKDEKAWQSLTGELPKPAPDKNSVEYRESKERYTTLKSLYSQILILITACDYDSAKRLLRKARILYRELLQHNLSCCINDDRLPDVVSGFEKMGSFLQVLTEFQNMPDATDDALATLFKDHQSGFCRKAIKNLKSKISFTHIISELNKSVTATERNQLIMQAESVIKSGFTGGGCSSLRKWAKSLLNETCQHLHLSHTDRPTLAHPSIPTSN